MSLSQDWRLNLRKGSFVDIREACGLWSRAIVVEMNTLPTRNIDNSIKNVRMTISYLHKSSRYDENVWVLDNFIAKENSRVYNGLDFYPRLSKITVWNGKKGWQDGYIHDERDKSILININKYAHSSLNLREYKKDSPCIQPFNFENIISNDDFDKLTQEISQYLVTEKKENALRKKKSKRDKILDEFTVKMKKLKKTDCSCFLPRVCNRNCVAFRRGWVNEFAYPKRWEEAESSRIFDCNDIKKHICVFFRYEMFTFNWGFM